MVLGDLSSKQVCPAIRDAKNLRQMFQQKKIIILARILWTWNRPNIFAFRFKPLLHRYLNLEEVKTYLLGFILEIFILRFGSAYPQIYQLKKAKRVQKSCKCVYLCMSAIICIS